MSKAIAKGPKLAAAVIAYQCGNYIGDLLKSLKNQVDVIVVGIDAKTTDNTRAVCEQYGCLIYDGPDVMKLDGGFAEARNICFSHIPADVEWAIWIDTDDILKCDMPLRTLCANADPNTTGLVLPYLYNTDEYGNVTTVFDRERVFRMAHQPVWAGPLHETATAKIMQDWVRPYTSVENAPIWIEHRNRSEGSKDGRNFAMLDHWREKEPTSSRAAWYTGFQHFAGTSWAQAAEWFEKSVQMRPEVNLESWQALIYQSKSYKNLGLNDKSIESANRAMMMYPDLADPYFEMAYAYQGAGEYKRAIFWHEEGLKKNRPSGPIMVNPLDYEYNPYVVIHTSYSATGQYEIALDKLSKAISYRPKDAELLRVKAALELTINRKKAINGGLDLAQHLWDTDEVEKAERVAHSFPAGAYEEDQRVQRARAVIGEGVGRLRSSNAYEQSYFANGEKDAALSKRAEWVVDQIDQIKPNARVLWFGIGNAQGPLAAAARGHTVVGVDIDIRRVKAANLLAVKAGHLKKRYMRDFGQSLPVIQNPDGSFNRDRQVQFWYGNAENPPKCVEPLGPYDVVVLGTLLSRTADHMKMVQVAESFGVPVIQTVLDGNFPVPVEHAKGTVRMWTRSELEMMFSDHSRILESHYLWNSEGYLGVVHKPGENWFTPEHPSVTIYCGPGWEAWTPDQIDGTGLGGSETAVVRLAEQFVQRGMRVMVYGPQDGVWNGVIYRNYRKFDPRVNVWMFVSWRNPAMFDNDIKAEHKVLWVHDTDYGDILTPERAEKIDSIWCMSEWHRQHLIGKYAPYHLEDRLLVVGNGIEASRFVGREERDPHRIVYSSSPDRGLEQVLGYWPEIRKADPEATLHIYYDFTNFDLMRGDPAYKAKIIDLAKQDGVTWRGRIGQKELAREFMRASVLFYPGPHDFCETFCITALEAQAAGCVPVTRDNGALPETNARGIVLPNDSDAAAWVTAVQEAQSRTEDERTEMRLWATTKTWSEVANRVVAWAIERTKTEPVVKAGKE